MNPTRDRQVFLYLFVFLLFLTLLTLLPAIANADVAHDGSVTVAVIDTGADLEHPALAGHLWTNPGESGLDSRGQNKANNQIDDDQNGFIDDVHGWDFVGHSGQVADRHGHGTHIAGIIARAGTARTVASQKPSGSVHLMILKYYDTRATSGNDLHTTAQAIRYAIQMGAQIINYSSGGSQRSQDEENAIREAGEKNILFIAAAGNEHCNSDFNSYFPADYGLTNILSVTAVDQKQNLPEFSNYGIHTVDLAAPGEAIYSALPKGRYGTMSGTSQATAFASAVAAQAMMQNPQLRTPEKTIAYLIKTAHPSSSLTGRTKFPVILAAESSLQMPLL
jgi:thermitase